MRTLPAREAFRATRRTRTHNTRARPRVDIFPPADALSCKYELNRYGAMLIVPALLGVPRNETVNGKSPVGSGESPSLTTT